MAMQLGDVVYLKSGGPAMTVNGFPEPEMAQTLWFSGSEYRTAEFPISGLAEQDPTPAIQVGRDKAVAALQAADPVVTPPETKAAV